jgi:hypothetical protein
MTYGSTKKEVLDLLLKQIPNLYAEISINLLCLQDPRATHLSDYETSLRNNSQVTWKASLDYIYEFSKEENNDKS